MRIHGVLLALLSLSLSACEPFNCAEVQRTHKAQEGPVHSLWFDDAGARLFAQSGGVVRVWDVASGTLERRAGPGLVGGGVPAGGVVIARDLSRMATFRGSQSGGTLSFFEDPSGPPSWETKLDRGVSLQGLGVGDSVIGTAGSRWLPGNQKDAPRLRIWRKGSPAPVLDHELNMGAGASISRDGRHTAYVRGEKEVVVLDVERASERTVLSANRPWGMLFSQDSTRLAVNERQAIRFFNLASSRDTGRVDIGTTQLTLLSFPDDLLASTYLGDTVFRWDASGAPRWSWARRGADGKNLRLTKFAAADRGNLLAISTKNDLEVVDPSGVRRARQLCRKPCYGGNSNLIDTMALSPSGDVVAVAAGFSLVLWDTSKKKAPLKLRDPAL